MKFIFIKIGQPVSYFFVSSIILVSFSKRNGGFLLLNSTEHFNIFPLYLLDLLLAKCQVQRTDVILRKWGMLFPAFIETGYLFKQKPVLSFDLSIFGLHEIIPLGVFLVHISVRNCLVYFPNTFTMFKLLYPSPVVAH